jgi:hypothetical protein
MLLLSSICLSEDQPPGEGGGGTQYFPGYTQKKWVIVSVSVSLFVIHVHSASDATFPIDWLADWLVMFL